VVTKSIVKTQAPCTNAVFVSVRSFFFRQLVAEYQYSSRGTVPGPALRVFWRSATKMAEQHCKFNNPLKTQ
jgi:hypothetical protein